MKLGSIIILIFLIVTFVATIGGTYYFYIQTDKVLEQKISDHLETTTHSKAEHIETFLNEQKIKIEIAQRDDDLVNLLKLAKQGEDYSYLKEEVNKNLNEFLYEDFVEIDLWDTNGIVLMSTNKDLIGTDYSSLDFYKIGKKETYVEVYKDPVSGEARIGITSPFFDENTGEFLGIYAVLISMDYLNSITSDRIGLGESGESYLINKEGYVITSLRFKEDVFLTEKIDSINAKNCLNLLEKGIIDKEHEGHEASEIYLDYRGIEVLGSHFSIENANWCLLTEINEEEVFGGYRKELIKTAVIILITLMIIVSIVAFFTARFISRPIRKLTSDVNKVSKGKLDIQLSKSKISEIQNLTDSLSRVLASMKLSILRNGHKTSNNSKIVKEDKEKNRLLHERLNGNGLVKSVAKPVVKEKIVKPVVKEKVAKKKVTKSVDKKPDSEKKYFLKK